MNPIAEPGRTSLAIDNLRAVVILLVIAFHAVIAYLEFLPAQPFAFDAAPYLWRAFPIVDHVRFVGFDLFCAWLDVFLMSFFFLLSGLFAWPSLTRRGAGAFLRGRLLRLAAPFALVVLVLMPPTLYPTYLQTAAHPGVAAYWAQWRSLPFWPSGPLWFLWLLLAGDLVAAALYRAMQGRLDRLPRLSAYARRHPAAFLGGFVLLSALAYLPPALVFGPVEWGQWGPFAAQLSRPAHYALYFFAGVVIGACGIERGLLAIDGPLPRGWPRWAGAAVALFALWIGLTALTREYGAAAPLGLRLADGISFVFACFAGCFFVLAAALRFAQRRWRLGEALKRDAYGMYLVHYFFIVWLQYALLAVALPAIAKATAVFAATALASWTVAAALRRLAALVAQRAHRPLIAPRPVLPAGRFAGFGD